MRQFDLAFDDAPTEESTLPKIDDVEPESLEEHTEPRQKTQTLGLANQQTLSGGAVFSETDSVLQTIK